MVISLRSRIEDKTPTKGLRGFFLNSVLPRPRAFRSSLRLAALAQLPFQKKRMIEHLPGPMKHLTSIRSLPALAIKPLRDRMDSVIQPDAEPRLTVTFFAGCLIDFVYPDIGEAILKTLAHYGVQVRFPKAQSCCGLPAYYEGKKTTAVKMARDVVATLTSEPSDYILTATPPCGISLRQYIPSLLQEQPDLQDMVRMLSEKCFEFSEFLIKVLEVDQEKQDWPAGNHGTILTYHDSCSALRGLDIHDAPRRILKSLTGYTLRELDEPGECCGFGGHFSVDYPDVAAHILDRKIAAIERTGASVVAVDSPGCLLHIRGALHKHGSSIQVKHIAELLSESKEQ